VIFSTQTRCLLLSVLVVVAPARRAVALLNFDGTRNQVFVFGDVTFAYNSNLFSNASAQGDYSVNTEAGLELKRKAGIIAVNLTAKIDYERFDRYTGQSAWDPSIALELDKTNGRTTGIFTVSVYRESRSDSAVNLRTSSWNVPVSLSLKYPLNDKFYTTATSGYLQRRYINNAALADYTDYTESLDLFYVYTSKLDLVGGYRLRASQTSFGPDTYDHWFNVGAVGALITKLNGSVRVGYQIRDIAGGATFGNVDAQASLSWVLTRKFTLSGQVGRDFTTIATGDSVDATTVALRANYVFTRKFDVDGGVAYGRNDFLEGSEQHRRDDFYGWDVSARYKFNEHLRLAASYNYLHNFSTLSFSDFERHGFSLDIASRF
jgi:hypothetical protein